MGITPIFSQQGTRAVLKKIAFVHPSTVPLPLSSQTCLCSSSFTDASYLASHLYVFEEVIDHIRKDFYFEFPLLLDKREYLMVSVEWLCLSPVMSSVQWFRQQICHTTAVVIGCGSLLLQSIMFGVFR